MDRERLAEWRELVASTGDDRADHEMMMLAELHGSWISPLDDIEDREAWWQILQAQVQLPDAAD